MSNIIKPKLEVNSEAASARALDEDMNGVNLKEVSTESAAVNADLVNLSLGVKDVNAVDKDGNSQLHLAARQGKTEIVECLLAHGVEKDMRNNWGSTALHLAASWTNSDVVKVLLKHGANVNAQDNDGYTPLHYATINNKTETVAIMIQNGADIKIKNKLEQTAFDEARLRNRYIQIQIYENHVAMTKLKSFIPMQSGP